MWDKEPITVQEHATAEQIHAILKCLQDIEPSTKLTMPAAKKFRQLMKVLNSHSITSDYHIQFFKKPLIDKFDCMACKNELVMPLIMPEATYNALHADKSLPLPIPKPAHIGKINADLHYMTLLEAIAQPFTDEHQPSK
eukprot:jgi/Tetstr1/435103/TSEL_024071.t1